MKCKVEACNREAAKACMCGMHYMRLRRHGSTDDTMPRRQCVIDGCANTTLSKSGICTTHYKQQWYLKKVGRDELIERTSQEYWINIKSGYIMVKRDGKLTYEHRVIAEKALGKPLPEGAVIHHVNGKPWDNRPENLVICPSQEYHLLLHKRMEELGYACD